MRAETWEVCTLAFMSLWGELCLCRTGRRRSGWAPAALLIRSLDRILWFTVRGELFWKFFSSLRFLHHFASPAKKKPESQQYFFTHQLPGLAKATYWTHPPPPIAVDTSFCVPFNQLITISHNPPLPHSAAFITHITVIIVMFYLREHFSLSCVIWIKEAFHTRLT